MHTANPAAALPRGLSWLGRRARRVLAAFAALALAASMAAALTMPGGDTSAAAGDDATVVAGASWSTTRSLLRAGGPGFDVLGASWS